MGLNNEKIVRLCGFGINYHVFNRIVYFVGLTPLPLLALTKYMLLFFREDYTCKQGRVSKTLSLTVGNTL